MDETKNNDPEYEEFDLSFQDLLAICCGRDRKNQPNCASTVLLQRVTPEGDVEEVQNIPLKDTEVRIITYRGCTVVQANFSRTSTFEYNKAYNLITNWINNPLSDKDGNQYILSLILVPVVLDGVIYAVINTPVYATGAINENGIGSIVMAFDTFSIQIFEDENADMDAIEREVKTELMRRDSQLDEEIASMTDEYEKATKDNELDHIYESGLQEDLNSIPEDDESEEEDTYSPFRNREAREEMRYREGNDDE